MSQYVNVLEEGISVTSKNRGFRTIQHAVATYQQTMNGLSNFYPKRIFQQDGIHTLRFNI